MATARPSTVGRVVDQMAAPAHANDKDFWAVVILGVMGDGQRAVMGVKWFVRVSALFTADLTLPSAYFFDFEGYAMPLLGINPGIQAQDGSFLLSHCT